MIDASEANKGDFCWFIEKTGKKSCGEIIKVYEIEYAVQVLTSEGKHRVISEVNAFWGEKIPKKSKFQDPLQYIYNKRLEEGIDEAELNKRISEIHSRKEEQSKNNRKKRTRRSNNKVSTSEQKTVRSTTSRKRNTSTSRKTSTRKKKGGRRVSKDNK